MCTVRNQVSNSEKLKLLQTEQFFGDVSVMQVCKFNANLPLTFHKYFRKKILLYVCQKMFQKREGKIFSCPWLFIYLLFKERALPLGENSCKPYYSIHGKHSMGDFDTPGLHRFS